jgi:hypothetical protein
LRKTANQVTRQSTTTAVARRVAAVPTVFSFRDETATSATMAGKISAFKVDLHGSTRYVNCFCAHISHHSMRSTNNASSHISHSDGALIILNRRLNQASWERNRSQRVMVIVDAGVGKHSGPGGAVLRPFVRSLLEQRGGAPRMILSPIAI